MDYDKIGGLPYRDVIKFRWCMDVDAERQNNAGAGSAEGGSEIGTIYSKEILMAGG